MATFRVTHQDGTTATHTADLPTVIRTLSEIDPALTFVVESDGASAKAWARAREFHSHPPIITITREEGTDADRDHTPT